jgi:hypothetical protein
MESEIPYVHCLYTTKKCTYFGCMFVGMAREGQQRLNVWLPDDLYTRVEEIGRTTGRTKTELVIRGLELVLEPEPIADPNIPDNESSLNPELLTGYQSIIENLEEQLKAKDDGFRERIEDFKDQLKVKDSQMENRVKSLEEQLRAKDSQLEKQAIHIQTMISQKAIEAPGAKKPWWQFW